MKKYKDVLFRTIILLLAILLVVFVPQMEFLAGENLNYIYGTFIGKKSEYNGLIEIWNIDSFESGIASKYSHLEKVGEDFQNENKGVFVMIRNLTLGECENLLLSGERPDLISCSYGIAEKLKDNFRVFKSQDFEIYENYLNSGKNRGGEQYGIAWCTGFYTLISTQQKLEQAGKIATDGSGVKLNEIAFSSGYDYKVGKKTKKSISLVYGTADCLMPKDSLIAYNKARSIQINIDSNNELILKSQYSAYSSFLANDSTILLGTQRDVCRMSAREKNGKVSEVVYLPLMNYTDLVQFMFCVKQDNELRNKYAEMFVKTLVSQKEQERLQDIGMFPVTKIENVELEGVMRDILHENISDCELKTIF